MQAVAVAPVETAPRRPLVKRLARHAIAFILGLLLLEALCWGIRDYVLPPKWSKNDDTDRMEPGFNGTIDYADTVEGRGARLGHLSVNKFGLRGAEPKLGNERAPNRLRVYCIGSSTTFGWGASDDHTTYPAQLEVFLKEQRPGTQVEVINGGVPGNDSNTEVKILTEDLARFKPDVVLIWSGAVEWPRYLSPEGRKKAVEQTDSLQRITDILRKTNTVRLAEYGRDLVTPRPKPPAFEDVSRRPGLKAYRKEVLPKWTKNVSQMIAECRKQGAEPIVLGLAAPLREPVMTWNPAARQQASNRLNTLQDAAPADLRQGLLDFDLALAEVCLKEQVTYLPPETLPREAELFIDGVHMKDDGYRALAKVVAGALPSK